MSAIPRAIPKQITAPAKNAKTNAAFLRFVPAIETHAKITFRHLPEVEREEAIAEATAAAFVNFSGACRNGTSHRVTPSTLAMYAAMHVKDGRRVGGGTDSKTDVMSRKAQRRRGFKVIGLRWDSDHTYACVADPTQPVWRHVLLEDRKTPVPDQVAFRRDWSEFMARQTDRTRQAMALLAAGYRQTEVADRLGCTPSAVCQRQRRLEREWMAWQAEPDEPLNPPVVTGPA